MDTPIRRKKYINVGRKFSTRYRALFFQFSWRQPADDFHGGGEQEKNPQLQALLDLDDRTLTQQASEQLTELNHRLALYRIKDYFLSKGKEVDIAQLKEKYPLHVLQGQGYYQHLEESLEWHLHPEHTKIAGLDDYQRLVLRNDRTYEDWESYCLTYHTYQGDLDYVRYYDEMSNEIKWIEDKVGLDKKQDYIEGLNYDFITRKDFDHLYLEIWKSVAKQKMDFYDALGKIYQQDMFPSLMGQIKLELEKHPPSFHGWMKKKYDTYVACIDEQISEEECHSLIKREMKKMFPEEKSYLDYAKKKIEVVERIGLITQGCPRQSLQYSKLKESKDAV